MRINSFLAKIYWKVLDNKDREGNDIPQEGEFNEDEEEEDYEGKKWIWEDIDKKKGDEDHPDFTLRSDDLGAEDEGGLDEQDELSGVMEREKGWVFNDFS